ncbi:hypothetical protein CVD28_25510 [Bacillus sp. M6-12]|uniref:ABC transporter permease subunit n=1 Tax=Bacillus sp. M6-12 TaxID=2054166 RepID=UPI000C78816E|nr:ABC transporter permease subunit [Bacillus sp. M6-12]PLS14881.1 hypothetical protein CVD28_25510 [Bacillus sp. M6-12]
MKKLFHYQFLILTSLIGFIFFLSLPALFVFQNLDKNTEHLQMDTTSFLTAYKDITAKLLEFNISPVIETWTKPEVMESYFYSLKIFGLSLIFTIILGFLFAFAYMMFPLKLRSPFKSALNFIEGIPDLLIIFLIQMGLFALYRDYGIQLFKMYGIFGAKPLILPVIFITIVTALFFAQFLVKAMEEEYENQYILLARAKGVPRASLLGRHLFRNIYPIVIIQFRSIVFMLLTSLVLVENMLLLNGYTKELHEIITSPARSVLSVLFYLFMFMVPVFLLEIIGNVSARAITKKRGVVI